MNILVALAVGYVVGAKTGGKDLDQLGRSLKALCETDEFADVVAAARAQVGKHPAGAGVGRRRRAGRWPTPAATWSPGSGTSSVRTDRRAPVRSVTSWPIPRRPTAVPAEPIEGWARTWTTRTSPSGRTIRYSSSKGRPDATDSLHARPASLIRSSGWMTARWDSNVPSKSSGSTPWIRWNSALHCTAPVRTSHSQLPTWARASPSREPGLDLGQRGLGQALLGHVPGDDHGAERTVVVDDRAERHRDRHRHAVGPDDLALEVLDPFTGQDSGHDRSDVIDEVFGEEVLERVFEHVHRREAEQPHGGRTPGGYPTGRVAGEDGVV